MDALQRLKQFVGDQNNINLDFYFVDALQWVKQFVSDQSIVIWIFLDALREYLPLRWATRGVLNCSG